MRLVIDPQAIQQITLAVGNIELPITREQLLEMLFDGQYDLVAKHVPKRMGRPPKVHTNGAAPAPAPSAGDAARAKKYAEGLCSKCEKKRLPNSKLCKQHYAVIIKNQKAARKAAS
jgi:hypothetical protein